MEVYLDDMLVKSVKAELPITHLAKEFQVLKSYNMKLNPAKCAFGVSVGKFLGFIVNSQGIEANLDKIKAVLDMLPPSNVKEVQRLTGRIAALSRFVSEAIDKCQPFFQSGVEPPSEGELLILYLAVLDFSTSVALVRERYKVQQPIYYCS